MNQIQATINGEKCYNIEIPFKYGDHLDESLDSATLCLQYVHKELFKPLSKVTVNLNDGGSSITKYYRIAADNSTESPNGTGVYRHEISLIEETKFLEGFMVESLCVTNAGGREYKQIKIESEIRENNTSLKNVMFPESYVTPLEVGEVLELPSVYYVINYQIGDVIIDAIWGTVTIYNRNNIQTFNLQGIGGNTSPGSFEIKSGVNGIFYEIHYRRSGATWNLSFFTSIIGQPNKYPLKPWTYKEVIERVLELAEPLVWDKESGDYVTAPRFKFRYKTNLGLGNAQEKALFNQYAPEFTFTRCTLREALQIIGGAIHAEPRLDQDGYVFFDLYGERELATYYSTVTRETKPLNQYKGIRKTAAYSIEQACTRVDSYIDNLVNQISIGDATVGQPYAGGYQSLRTDSAYIRVEEGTGIFPTYSPILKPEKLYWVDVEGLAGTAGEKYDITPYLFEKSVYDSQLSSYTSVYPSSKSYALYYAQGEKNIEGLFFENTEWTGGVLAKPAIVNILNTVTGKSLNFNDEKFAKLCFEFSYIPVYSARVGHGKQYVGEMLGYPRTIAHNQSDNMVEAQYFGENIKGLAERIGNIEKAYTYDCRSLSTIPTIGQLWDEEYYISSVEVEVGQDKFKVTLGLTKDFNRKSKYIGANSYRRIYEVSERMVQERQSLYTDYLVITDYAAALPTYKKNLLLNHETFRKILATFTQTETGIEAKGKVSAVIVQGETKSGTETLPKIILPVIASAFGNVMEFSWEFKDNYSAGTKILKASNGNVTGYFTQEVQYCDYYGRMYYENFGLYGMGTKTVADPYEFPEYTPIENESGTGSRKAAGTQEGYPIVKRKDSREALKENYAIEYVTDIKNMVIGSALAANNPMISGLNTSAKAKLVILKTQINKFSRKVNLSTELLTGNVVAEYEIGTEAGQLQIVVASYNSSDYLKFEGVTATVNGKAWALVTPVYQGDAYTAEDESGNISTVTPEYGGELLLGQNIEIASGDTVAKFKIVGTHDVIEYLKEKEAD